MQSWDIWTVSAKEVTVQEPEGQVLGCVPTWWGGKYNLPCEFNLQYPKKGKKCPPPLRQTSRHHHHWETVWISPAKFQIPPLGALQGEGGKREELRAETFKV